MSNKMLRISLEESVYELDRIRTDLENILQEDLVAPLDDIYSVLSDMYEYHIYTFGCTDPRVNELYIAKRADTLEYQEWVNSMNDFIKENIITIGGSHNEIE